VNYGCKKFYNIGSRSSVKGHIRGVFYCSVWFVSIVAGFYFLVPML